MLDADQRVVERVRRPGVLQLKVEIDHDRRGGGRVGGCIAASAAGNAVRASAAFDDVRLIVTGQRVVKGGADDVLDVGQFIAGCLTRIFLLHTKGEVDRNRGCRVLVRSGVAAKAAVQDVRPQPAFERVVAAQAAEGVIAGAADEPVRLQIAGDLVTRVAADDVHNAENARRARGRAVGADHVRDGQVDCDRRGPVRIIKRVRRLRAALDIPAEIDAVLEDERVARRAAAQVLDHARVAHHGRTVILDHRDAQGADGELKRVVDLRKVHRVRAVGVDDRHRFPAGAVPEKDVHVVAVPAFERVVSAAARDPVVAAVSAQRVVVLGTDQPLDARHLVAGGLAGIGPLDSDGQIDDHRRVRALIRSHVHVNVVRGRLAFDVAEEQVRAQTAPEHVKTAGALQVVDSRAAGQHVVVLITNQLVVEVGACHVFDFEERVALRADERVGPVVDAEINVDGDQ